MDRWTFIARSTHLSVFIGKPSQCHYMHTTPTFFRGDLNLQLQLQLQKILRQIKLKSIQKKLARNYKVHRICYDLVHPNSQFKGIFLALLNMHSGTGYPVAGSPEFYLSLPVLFEID